MNTNELLGTAIKDLLTKDRADEIAKQLVCQAKSGDHEALKAVLALSEIAEKAEAHQKTARAIVTSDDGGCKHPPELRQEFPVMGRGPKKEKCACGEMLVGGKPESKE